MVIVRRAGVADSGDIADLDAQCFPGELGAWVSDPKALWWVAWDGGKPVGFAGAKHWALEGERALYLHRCGVIPAYRGLGIQRRLLHARVRAARVAGVPEVWTYTDFKNVHSSNNLMSAGFRLWLPSAWAGENPYDLRESAYLYWYLRTR